MELSLDTSRHSNRECGLVATHEVAASSPASSVEEACSRGGFDHRPLLTILEPRSEARQGGVIAATEPPIEHRWNGPNVPAAVAMGATWSGGFSRADRGSNCG